MDQFDNTRNNVYQIAQRVDTTTIGNGLLCRLILPSMIRQLD